MAVFADTKIAVMRLSTWPVLPVTARTRVSALKAMLVTAYGSSPSSLGAGPVTLRSLLRSNSFPVLRPRYFCKQEIFLGVRITET